MYRYYDPQIQPLFFFETKDDSDSPFNQFLQWKMDESFQCKTDLTYFVNEFVFLGVKNLNIKWAWGLL